MRTHSNKLLLLLSFVFFFLYSTVVHVFAAQYGPNNTELDPTCAYTDSDCTVGQIEFLNEGVSLTNEPISVDFVGPGVTAITDVNGALTVTISGSGGAMAIDDGVVGGTEGSVLFVDSLGNLQEDPVNFYWDDASDFLGIGDNTPSFALDVAGVINTGTQFNVAGDFFATQDISISAIRIGQNAGNDTMSGNANTIVGNNAGNNLTSGYMNLFAGANAGSMNTTGNANVFLGPYSGFSNIDGEMNVVIGTQAGESNTAGDENTYLGYYAGNLATGSDNTLLGYRAGDNITTGSNNIIIGHGIDAPVAGNNDQLSIGNIIYGTGVDGTGAGNIGIGTNSPDYTLDVAGDFYNLYTDGAGVGLIVNGDLSMFAGDFGTTQFVGDSVTPSIFGYQRTDYNEGDPLILIRANNSANNVGFDLYSEDGTIEISSNPSGDANSYLHFNADSSIDLYSNISATVNSFIEFQDDGNIGLYSNPMTDVSSYLTLGSQVGAQATNVAGIGVDFMLNPDGYSLFEVDDEDDDGRYGVSFNSSDSAGGSIYHIRDLGPGDVLDDVVTYYWQNTIWHRVVTQTQYDIDATGDEDDFISNDFRHDLSGFHFNYQIGQGSLVQSAEGIFTINDDLAWVGDSTSFTSTIPASNTNDGDVSANLFTTTITSNADVTDEASYKGISSIIDYTSDNDLSAGISATSEAPIIGMYSSATNSGNGDVAGVIGGDFRAFQTGNGAATNVRGLSVLAGTLGGDITDLNGVNVSVGSFGPGSITESRALSFSASNISSGSITDGYGIIGQVTNSSPTGGVIDNAYAANLIVKANPAAFGSMSPTITSATGLLLKVFSPDATIDDPVSGTINTVVGIDMSAGLYGTDQEAGLESSGNTTGISFSSSAGRGSLEGVDVYGIYFSDGDSLQGSDDEYALYIGDTDAENWFANGARIGAGNGTDDTYKIDSESNGGSSSTLYIGNEAIDTGVSDRRLKTNITDAEGSALDFVDQFDVVQFNWLSGNDRSQYGVVPFGLIAQDVAELAPGYTRIPNDPNNYYSVRFGDMVPMLIKAIQEMHLEISGIQNMTDENFISHLQDWLASATNGIQNIFSNRIETNELCVGSRCITEEQFIQLLDENNVTSGGDNTPPPADNPPQDVPPSDTPLDDDGGNEDSGTPPSDIVEDGGDTSGVVIPPSEENTPPDDTGDDIPPPSTEDQNPPEEVI